MKYTPRLISIILFLALFTPFASAQNSWDFGSWNTLNLSYNLNKKFAIVVTQEARFKSNLSQLNLFYTNMGVEYRSNQYVKNAFVYRHIDKYLNEFNRFSFRHRFMWDMTLRYPINDKLSVSYRHRLQIENRNVFSSQKGYLAEIYSRNKFAVKYDLNDKISADLSAEFRYQLHDPRSIESEATWHRNRFMAGLNYKASNALEWGAYYLLQNEFNVSLRENLSIIGLELNINLNQLLQQNSREHDEIYLE